MVALTSLSHLKTGQTATIGNLSGTPDQVRRLQELGFRHGSNVEMVQPGRTNIVRLYGSKLSLRLCGGCDVMVHPPAAEMKPLPAVAVAAG